MKYLHLFIYCLIGISFGCAKKDNGTVLSFSLKSTNAYINQSVSFDLAPTPGSSYNWDFGDGTTQTTSASATHVFTQSGTFNVTVTAGGTSYSKKLRIYPGTCSFQFKNSFIRMFTSPSVDIYDTGGKELIPGKLTFSDMAVNATSDTIFVNLAKLSYNPFITLGLNFKNANNKNIGFSANSFAIAASTHSVYEITGTLAGTFFYSTSSGSFVSGSNTLTYADTVN